MNIFISYRRKDTQAIVGRIYDRCAKHFGSRRVFVDVDNMRAGKDFRAQLQSAVESSDAMLVVIGERWLTRLRESALTASSEDFVLSEIRTALGYEVPIIPLLIDEAEMPATSQLPDEISSISHLHAIRVSSGQDFDAHMSRVFGALSMHDRSPPAPRAVVDFLSARLPKDLITAHSIRIAASLRIWLPRIAFAILLNILALVASVLTFSLAPLLNASVLAVVPAWFGIANYLLAERYWPSQLLLRGKYTRLCIFVLAALTSAGLGAVALFGATLDLRASLSMVVVAVFGAVAAVIYLAVSSLAWSLRSAGTRRLFIPIAVNALAWYGLAALLVTSTPDLDFSGMFGQPSRPKAPSHDAPAFLATAVLFLIPSLFALLPGRTSVMGPEDETPAPGAR